MSEKDLKILFIGAGAIGGSVTAWLADHHERTFLFARGASAEQIRSKGITIYCADQPQDKELVKVRLVDDLALAVDADVVVLAVKLYSLEEVARLVKDKIGDRALIVAMQNGLENQKILPAYFSRVIYCIVSYNAWSDAPGLIGYQKKGPLILGTPDNCIQGEMKMVADIFNQGVETLITGRFQDAAHCKLVLNLSNSVTTLVGLNYQPIRDLGLLQKVLAGTIYEGVEIIRAAGYHEERLGGMPSWFTLKAAARLPWFLTRGIFLRNLKKMFLSSMAQDIFRRKVTDTELPYLNGYLLSLADRVGHKAPYNRAIYKLCQEHFGRPDFKPLDLHLVWQAVQQEKTRS